MLPDRKLAIIAKTFKEGKQLRSIFSEGLFAGMFVLFFDTQGHKIYYNVSFFSFFRITNSLPIIIVSSCSIMAYNQWKYTIFFFVDFSLIRLSMIS